MKLCNTVAAVLLALFGVIANAESLTEWLANQVRSDERLLAEALAQSGGHSLALLKGSRTYVPFFLEAPKGFTFDSTEQKALFDAWTKNISPNFLSGGYIYRLKFKTAPPLYAVSAGEWSGTVWRSLALGRDFTVESGHVWEGANGDFLYATLLAGVRPRLLVYDQWGEIAKQEIFDASAGDFPQRLEAMVKTYSQTGKPVLEMISLAEYLKDPDAPWRAVDTTGQFNLRNQQQRADEQERLKGIGQLTRSSAINLLQSKVSQRDTRLPLDVAQPQVPTQFAKAARAPTPRPTASENPTAIPHWAVVTVVIVAAIGLLWLLLKLGMGSGKDN